MTTTQTRPIAGGPNPTGLGVAAVGSGGTFANGTYFWKITFVNSVGETNGSNEVTSAIVLNGSANLTWPTPPPGTQSVKIYRGTVTNTENALVGTAAGSATAFTDTGLAGSGATPPNVSFSSVSLDSCGRIAKSSTNIASLNAAQQISALQAVSEWRDAGGGTGDHAVAAQARANAAGLLLQEV